MKAHQPPSRIVPYVKDLIRAGYVIEKPGDVVMSKPVGQLAKTLTDNVRKLQDRAVRINEEVQSSVSEIDDSLTQAEETSAALKKASAELKAALGGFSNNPPDGQKLDKD